MDTMDTMDAMDTMDRIEHSTSPTQSIRSTMSMVSIRIPNLYPVEAFEDILGRQTENHRASMWAGRR